MLSFFGVNNLVNFKLAFLSYFAIKEPSSSDDSTNKTPGLISLKP